MEIFDISVPIRPGMITYPGDPDVQLERVAAIEHGDVANISRLTISACTPAPTSTPPCTSSTRARAPMRSRWRSSSDPARSVDATGAESEIGPDAVPDDAERVLFKTRNSELWARDGFEERFVRLGLPAAERLVDRNVRLVGIDYLSVGGPETHRALLCAGIAALEGLDLHGIEPGPYRLACLPLRIAGSDGAPARAVLIRG